jgi:hypothetical protein
MRPVVNISSQIQKIQQNMQGNNNPTQKFTSATKKIDGNMSVRVGSAAARSNRQKSESNRTVILPVLQNQKNMQSQ